MYYDYKLSVDTIKKLSGDALQPYLAILVQNSQEIIFFNKDDNITSKQSLKVLTIKNIHLFQGAKGIKQWLINWCTSPIMTHKIMPFVDYN